MDNQQNFICMLLDFDNKQRDIFDVWYSNKNFINIIDCVTYHNNNFKCIICDNNYNQYMIDYSIDDELTIELINHD